MKDKASKICELDRLRRQVIKFAPLDDAQRNRITRDMVAALRTRAKCEEKDTVESKGCTHENCDAQYRDDKWGKIRAQNQSWFFQKTGEAWCPKHIPDWVEKCRAFKDVDHD